jgi:beta-galactosidase
MKPLLTVLLTSLLAAASAHARTTQSFDCDWRFHLGDTPQAAQPAFNDAGWRLVDVPHDWSIDGSYSEKNSDLNAYLPDGIGWYRKSLIATPAMLDESVWIVFDGAFMDSTVWLNGVELGNRPYGYSSFAYPLTGHLHAGRNVLAVRVDNALQPAARWYTGSGIYSHVTLVAANRTHIAQWGTYVRTPAVSADAASVLVSVKVDGTTPNLTLQCDIFDASGSVAAAASSAPSQDLHLHIKHPALWSPNSPTLYTARVRLVAGGHILDETVTPFGIRTAVFDANHGFLLNGVPLKLKGVADHLYGGPMGVAVPDTILRRRLQMLKDMGANAIRTSHNPHPPIFYDLCDQMGILVIDEIFDGWHRKATNDYGARFFNEWWQRDVQDWVIRDRNHPSVILWSIGNETGIADTFGITPFIHKLDARPTTGGMITAGVDVAGFNGPGEIAGVLDKFHAEHPTQPIVLTEEPHTLQTRGFYRVRTWWRDWKHVTEFPPYADNEIFFDGNPWFNSSYDNAISKITARQSWQQVVASPWISGEFRWCGFDYLGEAPNDRGRWPDRAMNYGIIDLAGLPKDDYYLYQSLWTTKPMVHLLPTWMNRGMDGVVIPVVAYSNQPEVELFLNGKSLGRQKPGSLGDFLWRVPYTPGTLKAVAYSGGQATANTTLVTAGEPVSITLTTDNATLKSNHTDTAVVTVTSVDAHGNFVPWTMNTVSFHVTGPVHLLGYDNGDPTDVTPNQSSDRRLFYGMARGFFKSTAATGPIEVTALSILGDESFGLLFGSHATLHAAIAVQSVALHGAVPPAAFEIRYTTDSSTPTLRSSLYSGPIELTEDTVVRAAAFRKGKLVVEGSTTFRKVAHSLVGDPRWGTDSQSNPLSPHVLRPD